MKSLNKVAMSNFITNMASLLPKTSKQVAGKAEWLKENKGKYVKNAGIVDQVNWELIYDLFFKNKIK